MKRIAVLTEAANYKIALIEDDRLVEYYVETPLPQRAGSIYKGRVVNVLPGMEAAFVDIGKGKNAFLHVSDMQPQAAHAETVKKSSIDQLVQVGDEVLVQVAKEPSGTKGAKITTHYSLPGRWVVYMPTADYVALSRKLESEQDKTRLRKLVEELRLPGEGFIVRTIAKDANEAQIAEEVHMLREKWYQIEESAGKAMAPAQIYEEVDLHFRIVRDLLSDEVTELWVNDVKTEKELHEFVSSFAPTLAHKIKRYEQGEQLFTYLGIDKQLCALHERKVELDNGSYIVIDHTEALTVIDVNTGKYIGSLNLEHTAFQANLEAAEEIGRIIRLRDIGGLIIVDFIDMDSVEHREQIVQTLTAILKKDRNRTYIVGWTGLGLLELTRKKVRDSMPSVKVCPTCGGKGIAIDHSM